MNPAHPFPRPRRLLGGFTLVELVCTLAIIAGLMTFAVWNYRQQTIRQRGRTCGLNLQLIEDAKAKFRADFPGTPLPADSDDANGIRRYFPAARLPTCPGGGAYTNVSTISVCACSLNFTARFAEVLGGSGEFTRVELRAARTSDAVDPNEGGDRAANGFHDVGYAPPVPAATPAP